MTLYPGCVVGDGVLIGEDSVLYPNVVVYRDCVIGKRAVVQAGAVIGSDGFGFAKEGDRWVKIPQICRVLIGDDVEIGANTSIDRGALDDTIIGDGVGFHNQIQIAHNVVIGNHAAMAGCVGVAGSTRIGQRCTIGGAGMIIGHLGIGGRCPCLCRDNGQRVSSAGAIHQYFPLESHEEWLQNAAQIKRLGRRSPSEYPNLKKLELMEKKS